MNIDEKHRLIDKARAFGYELKTIDDMMKIGKNDKVLIKPLIEEIGLLEDEGDKAFLVRCLSVKGFDEISDFLINEFKNAKTNQYRWVIGNAMYVIQDKNIGEKVLELVNDKKYGTGRQMIVNGLNRFNTEETKQVLIKLLDDDDVAGHAVYALSKFKDYSLIRYLSPLIDDKRYLVKKEAKKAIARLEKYK